MTTIVPRKHDLEYGSVIAFKSVKKLRKNIPDENFIQDWKKEIIPSYVFATFSFPENKGLFEMLPSIVDFGNKHREKMGFGRRFKRDVIMEYSKGRKLNCRLADIVLDIGKLPLRVKTYETGRREGLIGNFITRHEAMKIWLGGFSSNRAWLNKMEVP